MSARAASAPGAGVLDRLQVLRSAPTPLRGAPAATWTPSPRTGVGPLRVPGPGLQPSSHDTTTTRTDPAGSTLARPDFGPKDGVHLRRRRASGRCPRRSTCERWRVRVQHDVYSLSRSLRGIVRHQRHSGVEQPIHLSPQASATGTATAIESEIPHERGERCTQDKLTALRAYRFGADPRQK